MKNNILSLIVAFAIGTGVAFAAHTTQKRLDAVVSLPALAAGDVISITVVHSTFTHTYWTDSIASGTTGKGYAAVHIKITDD